MMDKKLLELVQFATAHDYIYKMRKLIDNFEEEIMEGKNDKPLAVLYNAITSYHKISSVYNSSFLSRIESVDIIKKNKT